MLKPIAATLVLFSSLYTSSLMAKAYHVPTSSLPSRFDIDASTGNNTFGAADGMVPVGFNANQMLYINGAAKYGSNSSWLASAGLGLRSLALPDTILGGYLFADYNRTSNSNYFPVLNPGIEFMTSVWDGHLNGYFPLGRKSKSINQYTANQLGLGNMNYFSGHAEYTPLFDLIENVGQGLDLEAGYIAYSSWFPPMRLFAGGYYFNSQHADNIRGVEAGITVPLNYRGITAELRDSYDNVHRNTFLLTLRYTVGGLIHSSPDVHNRMLDRIPRHLANLYNGDGIPSQKALVSASPQIVRDNIWFFNANGSISPIEGFRSCTFENPCFGLAQEQIDAINALARNANFYLSTGTYNNPLVGSGYSFYNGQNVYGRLPGFAAPASGANRPLLNDSFILNGNNSVNNLQIVANSQLDISTGAMTIPFQVGVLVTTTATGPVNIKDSSITSINSPINSAAVINNSAVSTLSVNNSTLLTSTVNIPGSVTIGAGNVSSGNLDINSSLIQVNQTDVANNFNVVFGVVNNENGTVRLANSNIAMNSTNAGLAAGMLNNSSVGSGTIIVNNSRISVLAESTNLAAAIFNQANNISGIGGDLLVNGSTLLVTSNNNLGGTTAGVFNTAISFASLSNSTVITNANDGTLAAIVNSDLASTFFIQNNLLAINLSGTAVGTPVINGGNLIDGGGNICLQDGVMVPC